MKTNEIGVAYFDLGQYMLAYERYEKGKKLPIYELCSKKNELIKLGEVRWFSVWRKFCYYTPEDIPCILDDKCIAEIAAFLRFVNQRKKEGKYEQR